MPSWTRLTWSDVLAPSAVLALGIVELVLLAPVNWGWGIVVEAVACALLVFRRSMPLVTCVAAGIVDAALPFVGPALQDVAVPIFIAVLLSYSLARWVDDLRGLLGLGIVLLPVVADYLFADHRVHDVSDLFFVAALLAPPYGFGRVTRRLAVTTELLREQQDLVRRQAVRGERDRIARELHDVLAHSVSAMVVQTSAARDVVRRDPASAEQILDRVGTIGRQTLTEAGGLLHVIRDADDPDAGLAPALGLADVPQLIEEFRRDGLIVDQAIDDESAVLPAGIDVSAYRIVEEALTNALRYAADGSAELSVQDTGDLLRIRCSNAIGRTVGVGSGLGLLGVAERAAVLGGRSRHGVEGGRFVLEVELPTGGEGR